MKKEPELYLLLVTTVIISGGLFFLGAKDLNAKRISLANSYYQASTTDSNQNNRLSLLLRSNLIAPNDDKKIEIATIYLNSGDYDRAESFLNGVSSQKGYINLAQALLEKGDLPAADMVIPKISSEDARTELIIHKNIISGSETDISSISNGELYLSRLLNAINRRNYVEYIAEGSLGTKLREIIIKNQGTTQSELEFATYLINNNQKYLADFIIDRIISEKRGLADAHAIRAHSFLREKQYTQALEEIDKAISFRTEEIALYQAATEIANQANQPELAAYYQQKILYLQKIYK